MSSLLDSTDYDLFDYRHADEPSLTLEDAMQKAAALRKVDKTHFHRIVPTDGAMTDFRIESVSRDQVFADFVTRASDLFGRALRRRRQLR